jgi:ribonuclease Z
MLLSFSWSLSSVIKTKLQSLAGKFFQRYYGIDIDRMIQPPIKKLRMDQVETGHAGSEVSFKGMELHFLGTSSSVPTRERNTSAMALKLEGEMWLFDCGEGVQKQLLFTNLSRARISKIFITHLHGDHCFVLGPLLCSLALVENLPRPHIYGPVGIKEYVEKTLMLTRSPMIPAKNIHEYIPKPLPHEETFCVHEDDRWFVRAGWIQHRIPCLGFIIQEKDSPGMLLMDRVAGLGLKPGRWCQNIKNGESIQLENGLILRPESVMTYPRKGRKFVILGDTSNPSSLKKDAKDADLLVHESTLSEGMETLAISKGHSTSKMAGSFAKSINAKVLILTHFSPRYQRHRSSENLPIKTQEERKEEEEILDDDIYPLVEQARAAFGSDSVFAAKDRWWISIARHEIPLKTIKEMEAVTEVAVAHVT